MQVNLQKSVPHANMKGTVEKTLSISNILKASNLVTSITTESKL